MSADGNYPNIDSGMGDWTLSATVYEPGTSVLSTITAAAEDEFDPENVPDEA